MPVTRLQTDAPYTSYSRDLLAYLTNAGSMWTAATQSFMSVYVREAALSAQRERTRLVAAEAGKCGTHGDCDVVLTCRKVYSLFKSCDVNVVCWS
jgi:hypothetical protein